MGRVGVVTWRRVLVVGTAIVALGAVDRHARDRARAVVARRPVGHRHPTSPGRSGRAGTPWRIIAARRRRRVALGGRAPGPRSHDRRRLSVSVAGGRAGVRGLRVHDRRRGQFRACPNRRAVPVRPRRFGGASQSSPRCCSMRFDSRVTTSSTRRSRSSTVSATALYSALTIVLVGAVARVSFGPGVRNGAYYLFATAGVSDRRQRRPAAARHRRSAACARPWRESLRPWPSSS